MQPQVRITGSKIQGEYVYPSKLVSSEAGGVLIVGRRLVLRVA